MISTAKPIEWIFIDIDGVLAPDGRYENWEPQSIEELCCFDTNCLGFLENVLRQYPDIGLAISSSWKEQFEFEKVQALFSSDIAPRIAGYTPFPDNTDPEWARRREIKLFLEERGATEARWLAIDDLAGHFDKEAGDEALIVKSAYHGFGREDAEKLHALLSVTQPVQTAPVVAKTDTRALREREIFISATPDPVSEEAQIKAEALQKLRERTKRLEHLCTELSKTANARTGIVEARNIVHTLGGSLGFINLYALGQQARANEQALETLLRKNLLDEPNVQRAINHLQDFIASAKKHLAGTKKS